MVSWVGLDLAALFCQNGSPLKSPVSAWVALLARRPGADEENPHPKTKQPAPPQVPVCPPLRGCQHPARMTGGVHPLFSIRLVTPEHLIQGICGADLEPLKLERRPQPSWIGRVGLPGSCLDFARPGPAMSFAGVMPRDFYTLVFVLDCLDSGHSFNFSVTHGDG
jgi:hypothetical protein